MSHKRTDRATAAIHRNAAALLKRLADKNPSLSPEERTMVSIYSSVIDKRTNERSATQN